ncbi:MAG: polyribonucleotide nucleotidyltransferase [Armatimonadetes bacterium]|nr:polyribonucleotide nucleotidyltransferase [Armatimonadota bacterium]MDW8029243.1 polyribonucleotide nucleotidyltransferase [Armatimonadota bacterium]
MKSVVIERQVAGKTFSLETGFLAPQADASVVAKCGDSMVLVTVVRSQEVRSGVDFFPLVVDFEERMYAAGRIPGHRFLRREGRPSDQAILTARLIDRSIRPLFPKGALNDVQVIITALSFDFENSLDILGLLGASAALTISDIPFNGPVAGIRIGLFDSEFVLNPPFKKLEESRLDLVVASVKDAVVMIEAGAKQIPEKQMMEAIIKAYEVSQPLIEMQEELQELVGKEKIPFVTLLPDEELATLIKGRYKTAIREAVLQASKEVRETKIKELREKVVTELIEQTPEEKQPLLPLSFDEALHQIVREMILNEGIRPDGRGYSEIRPITCAVGISPRAHGSGLFQRGETQVLTIATLGATSEEMLIETLLEEEMTKRFMHQYNFPPFSTGEVRPLRGPSRREIGHGALTERALEPVIPDEDTFPYAIRVVSEVLSSNGSTSMASACGGTLALMDAGVPILSPVAGISIGLVTEEDRYALLTDIQGTEDAHGDMDFKIAGTREGITAIQLDLKIRGLSFEIIERAFERAKEAREFILDKMAEVIDKPRPELSPHAPRVISIRIPTEKIGEVIGPRGKHIKHIQQETGTIIDIQPNGTVYITCPNLEQAEKAAEMVRLYAADPEVGKVYKGKVTRILPFGALVEILPGKEGLLHISQISHERIASVGDVLKVGDEIEVKVLGVEPDGKITLSRKELLPAQSKITSRPHIGSAHRPKVSGSPLKPPQHREPKGGSHQHGT